MRNWVGGHIMNDDHSKKVVVAILKEIGLEAEEISVQNQKIKTPDIKAWHKNEQYLIELKIKGDNPQEIEQEREILRSGEIAEKETPIDSRNRLSAIISASVEQFSSHDPNHDAFHVVWLHSSGQSDSLLNMRFRATLFGTQDLFSIERKGGMTAYYFKESSFFSHRNQLDGAILTYQDKLQLCVNTLSPNYQLFKKSFMHQALAQGLCDPESQGMLIADCNFDRKDKNKVLDYLRSKYCLTHLQIIDMKHYSAKCPVR